MIYRLGVLLGLLGAIGGGFTGQDSKPARPLAVGCLSLDLTPGYVKRDIDGDTFVLYSINVTGEERVRVLGVDTPEVGQPKADSATIFTTGWLRAGNFSITTCKRDSFGRLLAIVSRSGRTLADTLIILHLGVPR